VLTNLGWRWTFVIPVPIAIAALIAGAVLIPRVPRDAKGGHDLLGAAALTAGMLLAVYGLVSAPDRGWAHPLTLGLLAAAVALLAGFVFIEQRVRHPLIRLGILRSARIVRANVSMIALFGSYLSFQFMMTLYLQDVLHWSPLKMALALLPAGLVVAIGSPFVGRLIDRFGSGRIILAAMISLTLGYAWFITSAGLTPDYLTTILPTMLLLGGGFAFGFSSIMSQATDGIPDAEQGLASGLVQTSGQVGAALVLALVTGLVAGDGGPSPDFGQFQPGVNLVTGVAVLGLVLSLAPLVRARRRSEIAAAPR
jgi:predicted MFS family arabinose efflux permease